VQATNKDRILLWPALLAIAGPIAFVLASAGPFIVTMLVVPYIIVVLWMASGVFAAAAAIAAIYQRAWRRFFSALALPVVLLAVAFNSQFAMSAGRTAGNYVHLFVAYPHYLSEIEEEPANEPRLVLFEWDGFVFAAQGVLYDESDEIKSAKRSAAWKKRAERVGADRVFGYTPAIGHFYFVGLH
jgi:hypothetical protein